MLFFLFQYLSEYTNNFTFFHHCFYIILHNLLVEQSTSSVRLLNWLHKGQQTVKSICAMTQEIFSCKAFWRMWSEMAQSDTVITNLLQLRYCQLKN